MTRFFALVRQAAHAPARVVLCLILGLPLMGGIPADSESAQRTTYSREY